MNTLLIDLQSTKADLNHIPKNVGAVFLFARSKKMLKRAVALSLIHI